MKADVVGVDLMENYLTSFAKKIESKNKLILSFVNKLEGKIYDYNKHSETDLYESIIVNIIGEVYKNTEEMLQMKSNPPHKHYFLRFLLEILVETILLNQKEYYAYKLYYQLIDSKIKLIEGVIKSYKHDIELLKELHEKAGESEMTPDEITSRCKEDIYSQNFIHYNELNAGDEVEFLIHTYQDRINELKEKRKEERKNKKKYIKKLKAKEIYGFYNNNIKKDTKIFKFEDFLKDMQLKKNDEDNNEYTKRHNSWKRKFKEAGFDMDYIIYSDDSLYVHASSYRLLTVTELRPDEVLKINERYLTYLGKLELTLKKLIKEKLGRDV